MERFYGHLKAGRPKDEALRAAQLELLSGPIPVGEGEDASELDATHPYYWAAFVLTGDWG
jgi:CHAT domain-containing protein